jgi:glycerol-3-phosphate dehydrogenase
VPRDPSLLRPIAPGSSTTLAELVWGVSHEGALDTGDLLDRRTRVGLVPADRAIAVAAAQEALAALRH